MVPVLIMGAYILERKPGQRTHQVHRHLPCHSHVLRAVLAAQILLLEGVVPRRFAYDDVRRRGVGAYPYDVLYRALDGVYRYNVVQYLLVGCQALYDALELPYIGGYVRRDILNGVVRKNEPELRRLVAGDRHSRLKVGRLDIRHQPPLEAGAQTVVELRHLHRRPVGGDDYLVAGFIDVVEGVEKFLLRSLLAGDELNIVH